MSGGDWKEMYVAALNGNIGLVRYHITNKVDPNYQHPEILATPLVAAISSGHTEVALFLLENKADPQLRSFFDDMTPLEAAQRYQNQEILTYLAEHGIKARVPFWKKLVGKIFPTKS